MNVTSRIDSFVATVAKQIVLWVTVGIVIGVSAGSAEATIERYAVIIGNNEGYADEVTLQYAENDALKMRRVLIDLGGFWRENTVLLAGADADAVKRAIIDVNDRIRTRTGSGRGQAVLLVYYSGHADANALHLGSSTLDLRELEMLVRGSAAEFRLLVVDACRSGSLTRVKGGRRGPAFAMQVNERLAAEGVVFLTASSANEDAQESDELKGSFFTHYLVSGLMGAADRNGDGRVKLGEAYRYAYEHTLRASSRTLLGPQHPTFRYDMQGRDEITLTTVASNQKRRATIAFPPGRNYLLFENDDNGAVVAEVGVRDKMRRISVRPGRYFVRGRSREYLLEGSVQLAAGALTTIDDNLLQRIEYARLVRKGGSVKVMTQGPQVGLLLHTALANSDRPCRGGLVGYAIDWARFSIAPRLSICQSGFTNEDLSAEIYEFGAELRVSRAWDLPWLTVEPGVSLGATVFWQNFSSSPSATVPPRIPSRTTLGWLASADLAAIFDLPQGMYISADVAGQSYVFYVQDADSGKSVLRASIGLRLVTAFGKRF